MVYLRSSFSGHPSHIMHVKNSTGVGATISLYDYKIMLELEKDNRERNRATTECESLNSLDEFCDLLFGTRCAPYELICAQMICAHSISSLCKNLKWTPCHPLTRITTEPLV